MIQTYKGSCQCGAVKFEADFDPSTGTSRCNCTVCTRTEVLGDYSRSEAGHARFCKVCGVGTSAGRA